MRRLLITLGWFPAVITGVLALAVLLIFTTEAGLSMSWSVVRDRLPDGIKIESVEGRLIGPLTVRGVDIDLPTLRLEAERLVFDWRPSRLAVAKIQIATLGAEAVDIELRPSELAEEPRDQTPLSLDFRAPITLVVEQVFIRDLSLKPAPDAEPILITSADVSAVWDRGALEVSELDLKSPLTGHLSAQLFALLEHNGVRVETLALSSPATEMTTTFKGQIRQSLGRLNIALEGDWESLRWPLTGDPQVQSPAGSLSLKGTLPSVQGELEARVLSRGQPATLTVRGGVSNQQVDAAARWDTLAWPLEASGGDVQLRVQSGEITAKGPIDAVRLRGQTGVLPTGFQPIQINVTALASQQHIQLQPLRVDVAGSNTRLTGRVAWAPELSARLSLSGRELDPSNLSEALAQWPGQIATDAEVQVEMDADQIQIRIPRLHAEGQLRDQPLMVDATARIKPDKVAVPSMRLQALGGEINAQADLALGAKLQGQAQLSMRDLDPSVVLAQWPGRLGGDLRVELAGTQQAPVVRVPKLHVEGQLRDRQLTLDGRLRYADAMARIEAFSLASGESELTVEGRAGFDTLDLQWTIASPDLADFYPGLTGGLQGDGSVTGLTATPHLIAELRGESLGYQRYSVAGIDAAIDLNLADGSVFDLDVRLADAQIGTTGVRTLVLEAGGHAEAVDIALETDTTEGQVALELSGQIDLQARSWDGELTQLVVDPADFPAWTLESAASLQAGASAWSVSEVCMAAEPGQVATQPVTKRGSRLCLNSASDSQGLEAGTRIEYLDLAYLTPLLPPATSLTGSLRGEASYQRQPGREQLTADVTTSEIELTGTRTADDPLEIAFAPGSLTIVEDGDATRAQLNLPLEDDDAAGLSLDVRLPGQGPIVERSLDGEFKAELSNLDFVALLVDALTDVTGRLTAEMKLAGQVTAPDIGGRLRLTGAAASVDAAGIDLRDVEVTVTGDSTDTLQIEARASSGEGQVQASASARLGATRRIDARVRGERFLAYNTDDARVLITPDLSFELQDKTATLKGSVRVPSADITPQKRDSESLVRATDDEVIIGPRAETAQDDPIKLSATVDLILGDDVNFEGFGLTSRIEGQITARDRPTSQTTATGELRLVDGAYKAYGQNLDIRRGRLIFAGGPIAEPGLDVKASRYPAEDIEVGVRVRGPLNRPEFELYSEPSMAQQEQLSYLVLGRSLDRKSGASGTEQAALANAALALGLKGGGFLADTLQDKVGLDEISIGAQAGESNEQASLVLGKYLSPRLYVSYGVALFKPGQSFRLRYLLSDKWTLKTETGTQTGGDLIYTIERD